MRRSLAPVVETVQMVVEMVETVETVETVVGAGRRDGESEREWE